GQDCSDSQDVAPGGDPGSDREPASSTSSDSANGSTGEPCGSTGSDSDSENGSTGGPGGCTSAQDSTGGGSADPENDGSADPENDGSPPPDPGPADPGGVGIAPTASVLPAGFAGRINLTIPLTTLLNLAERPGELSGLGPVDPALARDLARAAAANPKTTWCLTVTDEQGHAIGHGCARPEPKNHSRTARKGKPRNPTGDAPPGDHDPPGGHDPPGRPGTGPSPGFAFTATGDQGPPGGYGAWRLSTGLPGQRVLLLALDTIALDTCDHRFEARGHDPGVKLRHLTQIRHATCVGPTCRRPSTQSDFEHNIPYEAGGRSCLCNGGPTCRHDHRLKQHPKWKVEQITPGTFRRTAPSGRQYTTEPTRYPI
ncbi:MAG TPA: hypothetical protein VHO07_13390, partial [Streptosporangiaceae bacterium]|nr:hypothetical protein [Streptosporangiaceae bacterium]